MERTYTKCQEGICPLCGSGELDYGSTNFDQCYTPWTCLTCGASGKEGVDSNTDAFDGRQFDVADKDHNSYTFCPEVGNKVPQAKTVIIPYEKMGICPICGSDDFESSRETDGYGEYWYDCQCNFCKAIWKTELSVIAIEEGYTDVETYDGESIEVTVTGKPKISVSEVTSQVHLCQECDSELCALCHEGICKFPLVTGKAPEITEDGCMDACMRPDPHWLDGIELDDPHAIHTSTEDDYSPAAPWNAPGMSPSDFIR